MRERRLSSRTETMRCGGRCGNAAGGGGRRREITVNSLRAYARGINQNRDSLADCHRDDALTRESSP